MNDTEFPPNLNPQAFSFLACLVGSALSGDFDAYEQASIGNWLMLVGEFMVAASAQQQLIEARLENFNININSQEHKSGGSFYKNNGRSSQTQRVEVDFLLGAVKKLQEELEALKKDN